MEQSSSFLQLRHSAPGLPGPYLIEHLGPYHLFSTMGHLRPGVILALGGSFKRNWLAQNLDLQRASGSESDIDLIALDTETLLLDAELHLEAAIPIPRISGRASSPNSIVHHLHSTLPTIEETAIDIYSCLLSQFSHIILVFVPDFPSIKDLVRFLCIWIKRSMIRGFPWHSRIILLHQSSFKEDEISFQVMASMVSELNLQDPTTSYSAKGIKELMQKCFLIKNILLSDKLCWLSSELDATKRNYLRLGLHFSSIHLKALLSPAIRQYAANLISVFNPVIASRLYNPIPHKLQSRIAGVFRQYKDINEAIIILASSLVLDAYPEGMHGLYPYFLLELE